MLKSRFIKAASKGTHLLQEVLDKYSLWKQSHKVNENDTGDDSNRLNSADMDDDSEAEFDDGDDWIFETLKSSSASIRGISLMPSDKLSIKSVEESMHTIKSSLSVKDHDPSGQKINHSKSSNDDMDDSAVNATVKSRIQKPPIEAPSQSQLYHDTQNFNVSDIIFKKNVVIE